MLAEELGHYFTSVGDIVLENSTEARKQELRARMWAYDLQIGLDGLKAAYDAGCRTMYEAAEFLDVPVEFLEAAAEQYEGKYGDKISEMKSEMIKNE